MPMPMPMPMPGQMVIISAHSFYEFLLLFSSIRYTSTMLYLVCGSLKERPEGMLSIFELVFSKDQFALFLETLEGPPHYIVVLKL